jgi:hypothetical protein
MSEQMTDQVSTPSSPNEADVVFISLIRMCELNLKLSPREMSLVKTKLQEAMMWFNEALVPKPNENVAV